MGAPFIPVCCPIRLLHGQCDDDISWKKSAALVEKLGNDKATLTLVKSGDHRLSRPEDIALILASLDDLIVLHKNSANI